MLLFTIAILLSSNPPNSASGSTLKDTDHQVGDASDDHKPVQSSAAPGSDLKDQKHDSSQQSQLLIDSCLFVSVKIFW